MSTNAELYARRLAAIPRGVANATPITAARAENAVVWDVEGKRYVDFAGGIAVLNTGHRHPKVMAAVERQMGRLTHAAFQVTAYEPYIELAEKLNALAPISGPAKTIFFTTGAEATENAVKIARVATKRSAVVAFSGGFHGRTLLATAMTGKVAPYKSGFGPLPSDVHHVPFPVPQWGISTEVTLDALKRLFKTTVEPERVAAIIIEPVQGEGGFHQAPPELMVALRNICTNEGIVLVVDEVQSGFGRTGRMFAVEHYDIRPDLIAVAKAIAGGFPLSGVIGRADLMDAAEPGGLGGTFAGSPVACAAGLAVLDVIEGEGLLERARTMGARLRARISELERRNDLTPIAAIRGLGAMVAFDIVKARNGHVPDADATRRVVAKALGEGLLLLSCGLYGNTVRILSPLTATDENLEEGLAKLEYALSLV
jgi:4-aminobutyrate aminotransferase / (S)-3-amino-2-methylpropionate transaminase / 5-aminovalerate transaminase